MKHATVCADAGAEVGLYVPFRIDGLRSRVLLARLVLRGLFHRVMTVNTPRGDTPGRRCSRWAGRSCESSQRLRYFRCRTGTTKQLAYKTGGRCSRTTVLDVANVIWCTGFHPGFSWIDLPIFGSEASRMNIQRLANVSILVPLPM